MRDSSPPAFPQPDNGYSGLTKREHFAAMAMLNLQNVFLRKSNAGALADLVNHMTEARGYAVDPETVIASMAVIQADALIEELKR